MIRFLYKLKLSLKILSLISVILIISLVLINIFFIETYYSTILSKDEDKAIEIAKMFAQLSSNALHRQDYYTLESNVKHIQNNSDILYAKVIDGTNIVVTPSSRTTITNDYLSIQEPIFYNETQIGFVQIGLDLTNSLRAANKYKLNMFLSSLLIVIIVLFLLYILIQLIILKPIVSLMNSVSKISAGNLEQEVPVKSNDEIGLLSKSFNIMLKNLKDNIALTQNILEVMPILLIILDHNFKIIKCNSNVEIYFNVKLKEIEKKVLWEEIEFFDKYKHNCMDVLINSKPMHIPREAFKDKEESYYELYLYPLKIQSLNGVVLRLEDVTEAEKRDSQLRQAQKMETVGTLAGGLAHDFNNILCGIIGTVSMLKFKLFKDKNIDYELLNRYIDTIEQASNRAEDMVQQFLALSRKQELNFTKVDLNTCLKHVYKICKNTFDKCINLEVSYNPDQAYTLADMTQIEQVLLNLCINASHAMTIMKPNNQGGTLRLTIEIIETDKYIQKTHNEAIDNFYWKLSVSDTGVGIEKKNISKIFDPFFTTKDKGLGTGLGLAMVYNIIKQHNGFIELYTEIGEGTNIIVYLPVLKSDEITEQINIQEHEIFKGNKETILLVDDEMIIQQIGKEILEECNYNVIICSDGEEAILYYKNEHEYIDLVILDMLMPKKSGKDTFIEIKKINPNAKIILCSGFKQDNRVEKLFELGLKYFIQKPFSLYKLSKIVKDALNDIA